MKVSKLLMALAMASMATAPALAAPTNAAANLSVAKSVRTGTSAQKANAAFSGGLLIALLAAVAVVAGVVIIANDDDDSDSN